MRIQPQTRRRLSALAFAPALLLLPACAIEKTSHRAELRTGAVAATPGDGSRMPIPANPWDEGLLDIAHALARPRPTGVN